MTESRSRRGWQVRRLKWAFLPHWLRNPKPQPVEFLQRSAFIFLRPQSRLLSAYLSGMTRGRDVLMTFGLSEAVATRHCRAPTTSHRQATAREKVAVSRPGQAIRGIWCMSTPFARRACQTACMGMLLVGAAADPQSARAFDLFGLLGSDEKLPIPSASSLPYTVMIQGIDNDDVLKALKDTSTLYRLRQEDP